MGNLLVIIYPLERYAHLGRVRSLVARGDIFVLDANPMHCSAPKSYGPTAETSKT